MHKISEKNLPIIDVKGNKVDKDHTFGVLKKLISYKYNQVHFNLTLLGIFYH